MLPAVLNRLFNPRDGGTDGVGLSRMDGSVGIVGGSKSSSSSDRIVGYCRSSSSVSDAKISWDILFLPLLARSLR